MTSTVANLASRPKDALPSAEILGSRINALGWDEVLQCLTVWAAQRQSRYVCISNVHMVVTARADAELAAALRQSDMATPDGAPIAWMLRRMGFAGQPRISGTELMRAYLAQAAGRDESTFLFGSSEETLKCLQEKLLQQFPGLRIVGTISPPFRPLSGEEDEAVVAQINASGAGTVWVSLGCPKQEKWMLEHRGKINAVMLGVGAAFDFIANRKTRAPVWMQERGLEWLFRLMKEPRRLWKRYLYTNSLFMLGAAKQLLVNARTSKSP